MLLSSIIKEGSSLPVLAVGAVAAYIFIIITYRLFFHPLSKYPGPILGKVTDLYQTYHAWTKTRHTKIKDLHDQYGDYVRYGPNLLLVRSSDGLKAFYGTKANTRKADSYTMTAVKGRLHIVSEIDKTEHARKRRTLAHAFSDQALREMKKHILSHVDALCKVLPSEETPDEWGPSRNMSELLMCLTFDIICDLAYGKEKDTSLEVPENRFIFDLIGSAAYRLNMFGNMLSWLDLGLDRLFFPKLKSGSEKFRQFSRDMALGRVKMGNDVNRRDFFHHLINAKDPVTGRGLEEAELWGESNVFIVAGTDTTAIALSSTFFYLTLYPEVLKKLEDELLSTFGSAEEIAAGPALSSCKYLRAVIDESMRISPSVPGYLGRTILEGGATIDDTHYIPEGVNVGTGIWSIHHDERYFPNPSVFSPERWIPSETNSEEQIKLAQSAFNPFSLGARGCLGKNLAYIEMLTTVSKVLWLYEMRREPGSTRGADASGMIIQQHDVFTSQVDGPMVQFRRRRRQ